MKHVVDLEAGRRASYEVIGQGRPALWLPGGFPGEACMRAEATLLADELEELPHRPPWPRAVDPAVGPVALLRLRRFYKETTGRWRISSDNRKGW